MNKHILGLHISDTFIAAVVLVQRGKERQIVSCDSVELEPQLSLTENLLLLLEKIDWKTGVCICGVSLANVSVRNLTIPFADKKKIKQVMSFELEDQLILPASEHIAEHIYTGKSDSESRILVTAIEKEELASLFENFEQSGLDPHVLGISHITLAEQTLKINKTYSDVIFLDTGLHYINILFCQKGEVVFLRHLPYPEKMVVDPPFYFEDGNAGVSNNQNAMECIESICGDINRSLGFYNLQSPESLAPERVIITGCVGQVETFRQRIQAILGISVVTSKIVEQAGITLSNFAQKTWDPVFQELALCLALEGLVKKHSVNFRKDEFAGQHIFAASKGKLVAAAMAVVLLVGAGLVYLGLDYHDLKKSYDEVGDQMQAIFLETFPDRTKSRDPLLEMQASVKNIQAPTIEIPVFTGDKRVLNILADISGRIPKSIKVQVSRLVIDQKSVQIKGLTNTYNNVNIIENNIRKSGLYHDVDIISAVLDKKSKMIRFELKLATGGA